MPAHFISNYSSLSKTKTRRDAMDILEAGLDAVKTDKAVRNTLKLKGNKLFAGRRVYDLKKFEHIHVVGFGKASFAAAIEIEKILSSRITSGIVLDVRGGKLKKIKSIVGTHPFPGIKNVRAAGEIMKILENAKTNDLIIVIVSGGGSALLCRPSGIKCGELALVTKMLMHRGANIREMNTVRKHLSEIKGGQLVQLARKATILGLIFSDVPGDDMGMVASGPTVRDTTTAQDAAKVLEKYDIIKSSSLPSCDLRNTPKDKKIFKNTYNILVVANGVAVEAMKAKAKKLGYKARIISTSLQGEARSVGRKLAAMPEQGEAVIAAGETTVTVVGNGIGGRSQELVLGALDRISDNTVVVSCASDGRDNSIAAGGIVDGLTRATARRLGLRANEYLAKNNTLPFLKKTNSLIMTGYTGINVSDLMVVLRRKTHHR